MVIATLRNTSIKQSYSVILLLPFILSLLFFWKPFAQKIVEFKKTKQSSYITGHETQSINCIVKYLSVLYNNKSIIVSLCSRAKEFNNHLNKFWVFFPFYFSFAIDHVSVPLQLTFGENKIFFASHTYPFYDCEEAMNLYENQP